MSLDVSRTLGRMSSKSSLELPVQLCTRDVLFRNVVTTVDNIHTHIYIYIYIIYILYYIVYNYIYVNVYIARITGAVKMWETCRNGVAM